MPPQANMVASSPDPTAGLPSSNRPTRRAVSTGSTSVSAPITCRHDEADRLAERLVRLGYNALRIHHYERDLVLRQNPTTQLNPERLEQFDYLMAALIQRGIYLTTDLYVSRGVPFREIGMDRDGNVPMDTFKILVPVHAGAWENWKAFSRALLDHVNPHTQRRYAEEPALAWLAMINEGNLGNFYKDILTFPEWQQAWNRWLAAQYADRSALAQAWNDELADTEDPANASVKLPEKLDAPGPRARDTIRFLSDTERDLVQRMKTVSSRRSRLPRPGEQRELVDLFRDRPGRPHGL